MRPTPKGDREEKRRMSKERRRVTPAIAEHLRTLYPVAILPANKAKIVSLAELQLNEAALSFDIIMNSLL